MEIILASIALLPPLAHCGNKIRKAIKEIKSSRRDILELTDETVIFSGLCEEYLRACADKHEVHACRSSSVRCLKTWIRKLLNSLEEVLQKVEALKRDRNHRSSIEEKIIAYIEWLCSGSSVQRLRANMAVASEAIKGFTNLMYIQKLNKELQMLRDILASPLHRKETEEKLGMTIEEKIESINQALEIKNTLHETSSRHLEAAKRQIMDQRPKRQNNDFVPAPAALLKLAASFDTYAKEVLPSRESSPGLSSSRAPHRAETKSRGVHARPQPTMARSEAKIAASSSSSALSSHSNRTSFAVPSSTSSNYIPPETIAEDKPRHQEAQRPIPATKQIFEHTSIKGREYINDPEGTILSPPKVKIQDASAPLQRKVQIGRHIITLTPTELFVNRHSLHMSNHDMGVQFIETLKQHPELLDSLEQALGKGLQNWGGIPKWIVRPTMEATRQDATGVRDV
ncbi:hypothetical protein SVAN01_00511 [Stagonosporopsis vannaccii]|nr:hypothetical protein SVAN01_00511 [Stagonosporopsis vannaccii]